MVSSNQHIESDTTAHESVAVIDPDSLVGFWPRFVGTLADFVLVTAIVTPILIIIYGPNYLFDGKLVEGTWHIIIGCVLPALGALWFLFKFQATPGKMIVRAQIVHQDTRDKPKRWQFVVRYLAFTFVSLPPLGLGCWWILWDPRKQSWHDKIAKTLVIHRIDQIDHIEHT